MAIIASNALLTQILEELDETGAPLDAMKVHLFKEDLTPQPDTPLATFTAAEADYTGYAASAAIVWSAAYIAPDGSGRLRGAQVQFIPTGTAATNLIYGYWIQLTTGATTFALAERFAAPVSLASPFDSLFITPEMIMRQPS